MPISINMKYCDLIGAATIQLARVKYAQVTRPFYSERRQQIKKSERVKWSGYARLRVIMVWHPLCGGT